MNNWFDSSIVRPLTDKQVIGIQKNVGLVVTNYYPRIKVWRHGHNITHWMHEPAIPTDIDTSEWRHFHEAKGKNGALGETYD